LSKKYYQIKYITSSFDAGGIATPRTKIESRADRKPEMGKFRQRRRTSKTPLAGHRPRPFLSPPQTLLNNSTYHRRILEWKTQRTTHPGSLEGASIKTHSNECSFKYSAAVLLLKGVRAYQQGGSTMRWFLYGEVFKYFNSKLCVSLLW